MNQLAQRVLNLMSKDLNFLMYRGGSGGEFLSKLIYQYSKKYSTSCVPYTSLDNVNKTVIHYPNFFNQLVCIPSNSKNNNILPALLPYISDESLDEAEQYLSNYSGIPLFRCHFINAEYFRTRSIFIFLDEKRWWDYAGMLSATKNKSNYEDINLDNFKNMYNRFYTVEDFNNNKSDVLDIQDFMKSNNLTEIHSAFITLSINKHVRTKFSVADIVTHDIKDLCEKFELYLHGDYASYRKIRSSSFMKTINFSNYFIKGYLEDIFEIDSNTFHDEILGWHERNLELLSNHNIDITQFKLT